MRKLVQARLSPVGSVQVAMLRHFSLASRGTARIQTSAIVNELLGNNTFGCRRAPAAASASACSLAVHRASTCACQSINSSSCSSSGSTLSWSPRATAVCADASGHRVLGVGAPQLADRPHRGAGLRTAATSASDAAPPASSSDAPSSTSSSSSRPAAGPAGASTGTPSKPRGPKQRMRLDEYCLQLAPQYSRNVIQSFILQGKVRNRECVFACMLLPLCESGAGGVRTIGTAKVSRWRARLGVQCRHVPRTQFTVGCRGTSNILLLPSTSTLTLVAGLPSGSCGGQSGD